MSNLGSAWFLRLTHFDQIRRSVLACHRGLIRKSHASVLHRLCFTDCKTTIKTAMMFTYWAARGSFSRCLRCVETSRWIYLKSTTGLRGKKKPQTSTLPNFVEFKRLPCFNIKENQDVILLSVRLQRNQFGWNKSRGTSNSEHPLKQAREALRTPWPQSWKLISIHVVGHFNIASGCMGRGSACNHSWPIKAFWSG